MTKFSIDTSMRLTSDGKIGATMFILAPIASGIIYPFLISAIVASRTSTSSLVFLAFLMIVSVCAFLGGFVMLFLGRHYEHHVEVQRD